MIKLRQYQIKAVNDVRSIIASGKKRVILYSSTGSGKTCIAFEIIRLAIEKSKKVLFVCNRIELVKQASRRLLKDGIEHDIIQGASTSISGSPIKICSIQTLDRRGYPEADLIIEDEAHSTAGSKAYQRFMEHFKDIPIIGLTATPFSIGMAKEYPWGTLWEALTSAATIRELIDLGYLVDVEIYAPSEPDLSKVKIVAGDYDETQLGVAVDKQDLIGDIVTHWKKLGGGKSTVCFATNIAHSRHIVEEFLKEGISAEHIDYHMDNDERRLVLDRVNTGETKIVSCVSLLAEGWDEPRVEVMISARPTKSLIRWIQTSGRILRPFEGKSISTILDHAGNSKRLGFPTDDLPLFLDDGKPRDAATKKKEEKAKAEKLPVICPQCSAVLVRMMSTCPRCGHVLPGRKNTVETIDGDLVKVVKRKGKLTEMPVAERNKTYGELRGYAAQKGKKDGWAWYKCRELFGSAPREKIPPMPPSIETLKLIKHLNVKNARRAERSI